MHECSRWHHLTHEHTKAERRDIGEAFVCRRRLGRIRIWFQFADTTERVEITMDQLGRIARCDTIDEAKAIAAER